jgi:putative peptidoglycan lipid II flippase
MVRSFLTAIGREVRGMHEAAYLLAAFALASQLLALVRDRLLAGEFGASHTLDVYYAAFRVPDFLFATIASLLSLYALLPILSRLQQRDGAHAISFLRLTLLVFFVVMAAVAGVVWFLAPYLVAYTAPGLAGDEAAKLELVVLVRILLLQPIFLGASNIVAALTQLRNRFFLYAVSPLLYNLGIIIGIVWFYPTMGIAGLGWGVVLGALMHVGLQLPFFFMEKSKPLPRGEFAPAFFEVLKLSIPRTLALASGQFSLLALVALASLFATGSIAVFMFAWNLQSVPLAIIGVSYSVAAFPTLARFHASGNRHEFVRHIEEALRHMLFWSIPAIMLTIVLRAQLVRVILGSGEFDWDATRLTAAALALFILSLCAQSVSLLIARAYYAAGKTRIPLLLGVVSLVTTVVSAAVLVFLFHASPTLRYFLEALMRVSDVGGTSVLMLALGYTLGAFVQCILGLVYFSRDFGISLSRFKRLMFQSISSSIVGSALAYIALTIVGDLVDINTVAGIVTQGFVGGLSGGAAIIALLYLLKNEELKEAMTALKRRMGDTPSVAVEPTDVSSSF